jgi:hypothetical protein
VTWRYAGVVDAVGLVTVAGAAKLRVLPVF